MNIKKLNKYIYENWNNVYKTNQWYDLKIRNGIEIKNYKTLCELLDEPIKTGNSKIAQLKEWNRYFIIKRFSNKYLLCAFFDNDEYVYDWVNFFSEKKRPLLTFGKNDYESGMKEVIEILENDRAFNRIYLTDLNEFMLIGDINSSCFTEDKKERTKIYSMNELARLFQYINYNYSRFVTRKKELALKTEMELEDIEQFYYLTKKSYSRIIDKYIKRLEGTGRIKASKVLCGYKVNKAGAEGYYSETEYHDATLNFRINQDIKTQYDKLELDEDSIRIFNACEQEAVMKMHERYSKTKLNLETVTACKRFRYKEYIKTLNEITIDKMNLVRIQEQYKITVSVEQMKDFYNSIVYDAYMHSVNCLYQNRVFIYKLKCNAQNRAEKSCKSEPIVQVMSAFSEDGKNEGEKNYILTKLNETDKLTKLLISMTRNDVKYQKELLNKDIDVKSLQERETKRIIEMMDISEDDILGEDLSEN